MNTPVAKTFQQALTTAFDPRSIPGCSLWLDAGDSNTLTLSGSNISSMADKSGNGRTGTATGTVPYVSNAINGLGGISFTNALNTFIAGSIPNTGTTVTGFVVGTMNASTSTNGRLVSLGVSNANDYDNALYVALIHRNGSSNSVITYRNNAGSPASSTFSYDTPVILGALYNNTNGFIYANGTSNSYSSTGTFGIQYYRIGNKTGNADAPWYGYVGELLIYNAALSTSERQAVEGYLAAKWGLTSSIPATHPFKLYPPITRAFAPSDISGCVLWIDAADATTVTLSGNNITQLLDKSSNAYVFATASGFTYDVVKFNTSYPSFYSPTSTAGYSLGSNASFTLNQPFTTFAVGGNLIAPASGGYFWDSTSNANRGALLSFSPGRPTMFAGVELFSTNSNSFTNALIISSYYNSTSSSIFEFGVDRSSNNNVGTQNMSSLRLGAAWPLSTNWNGHICEIVFFNRLLSTTERQQMEGYLANKWGLRGSLASTHPFKLYNPMTPAFTPVQVSGCSLWLDAGDATTLTLSGSNVTAWADKSGNARNTTSTTGTPTYITNPSNNQNGVFFNGSSYFFGSFSYSSNTLSTFLVGTIQSTSTNFSSRLLSLGIASSQFDYDAGTKLNAFSRDGIASSVVSYRSPGFIGSNMNITLNVPFLVEGVINGSSNLAFVNGNSATGFATSGNFGFDSYALATMASTSASTQTTICYIFEVLIYNTALTTPQRQAVEGYLAHKWGLVSSLPASHPYKKFRN